MLAGMLEAALMFEGGMLEAVRSPAVVHTWRGPGGPGTPPGPGDRDISMDRAVSLWNRTFEGAILLKYSAERAKIIRQNSCEKLRFNL